MKKEELNKLRTLNATPSMIMKLKKEGNQRRQNGTQVREYQYWCAARVQQLNGYLKVSICTRKDVTAGVFTPKWDIFINYDGDEYITRERQQDGSYKWRDAMCENLENESYWYYDYDEYCYINPEGERSIKNILKTQKSGWDGLYAWQQGCKKRKEDQKIEKLTKVWDAEMKPIKDVPKGFEEWAKKSIPLNYIFYKKAGERVGYCTGHLGEVQLDKGTKHNQEGICPVCNKKITYISRAKKTNPIWSYWNQISCIQSYPGGVVLRTFFIRRIDKKLNTGENHSKYLLDENERIVITKDKIQKYKYGDYRRRGERWYTENDFEITAGMETIFPSKNLNRIINRLNTSYLLAVKDGYYSRGFAYFIFKEREQPIIELCYKAGLNKLAYDFVCSYWRREKLPIPLNNAKDTLAKKLGIDSARMHRLKEMNGDLEVLEWLQKEKLENTIYDDEDLKILSEANIVADGLKNYTVPKHLSIKKICNYLRKQKTLRGGNVSLNRIWQDWNDYVSMLQKAKMDCTKEILLKPKDLLVAHNEMVASISMKNSEKEIKKMEKKYKEAVKILGSGELKKYEYADDDFCIIAPTSIKDIYQEGTILKHCIHTCEIYFNQINIRETFLVFLRRASKPNQPWYTLEIEPGGNIRQKKSVLNESYSDLNEAIPFLKDWQKEILKQMTEEDKRLAAKSEKARKEGYQKLREEKKIVWHGSFQGKLLADALESDFMANTMEEAM